MNGKCKKIGFGLSGLMCAGLLFSCVSTSEAGSIERNGDCSHPSKTYLGSHKEYDSYDHSVHDVYTVHDFKCNVCKETLDVYVNEGRENHDITEYWDDVENCWAEECGRCGYTYYYH